MDKICDDSSPTPSGSGVGGWILQFFKGMGTRVGLTPYFLPKMYGDRGGVTSQNEACMNVRCGTCILCRGIKPENVCFAGGTTDKSQWIHKLFQMYGSMGVLQLNPVDSFSWETFWLHEEKIKINGDVAKCLNGSRNGSLTFFLKNGSK